jgi:thiol-disulfide isomerase/thioredoxin
MLKAFPALALIGVALGVLVAQGQQAGISVKVVKYDALKEEVLRQRGKVVVVDFWADYCIPCKRNMPHVVEMAQKYGSKGLAVITVSIDDYQKNPAVKDNLEKFLTKVDARAFTNLLLDEPEAFREQRLHFKSVPTVFVFDRRGRWVQFTDEVDPEQVEKTAVSLLGES